MSPGAGGVSVPFFCHRIWDSVATSEGVAPCYGRGKLGGRARDFCRLPAYTGAGIMAMWQVALVKQLRIMGSNPSQPHILEEGRRKAEDWRKALGGRTGFSAP